MVSFCVPSSCSCSITIARVSGWRKQYSLISSGLIIIKAVESASARAAEAARAEAFAEVYGVEEEEAYYGEGEYEQQEESWSEGEYEQQEEGWSEGEY